MEGVRFPILPQPDDWTCGPTCLQAVYAYWGDPLPLDTVIQECGELEEGGTLASLLGRHALQRNYRATIYTFNVGVFDPTWFQPDGTALDCVGDNLAAQSEAREDAKFRSVCQAYRDFLSHGGSIKMVDLTRSLISSYLRDGVPVLTGLSSTFLYRSRRERLSDCEPDDIRGLPTGHFVVLCGYDSQTKAVRVADPYLPNPLAPADNYYSVNVDRVVCAILLGALTYDANLLIIQPKKRAS